MKKVICVICGFIVLFLFELSYKKCFISSFKIALSQAEIYRSYTEIHLYQGKRAAIKNFPWSASLTTKNGSDHHCMGSIISEKWILTTASCAKMVRYVVLGIYGFDIFFTF